MVQGRPSGTAARWPSNPKPRQPITANLSTRWHSFRFLSKCPCFRAAARCTSTLRRAQRQWCTEVLEQSGPCLWLNERHTPHKLHCPPTQSQIAFQGPEILNLPRYFSSVTCLNLGGVIRAEALSHISIYSTTSAFIRFHVAWLAGNMPSFSLSVIDIPVFQTLTTS